jgi:predicted phosphodiesterase
MPSRLAVLSDLHADAEMLRAALAQLDAAGVEHIVCAGDLVDEGRDPEELIALLVQRGIPSIRGNHDRWALDRARGGRPAHVAPSGERQLSPDAMRWLAALPARWDAVIEGVRVAVRHARPGSDMDGIEPAVADSADLDRWLRQAEADVLVVGHTHAAWEIHTSGNRRVLNPGALGRGNGEPWEPPILGIPGGRPAGVLERGLYGVLDLPSRRWTVYRAGDGSVVGLRSGR